MRIVTWNIHRGIGTDGRYDPERVVRVLSSIAADVIMLQECDSSLRASRGLDQVEYIADALSFEHVMGPTLTGDYGSYGNTIFSRYEILSCEEHDLSVRRFEPRGAVAANLKINNSLTIRAVNTHLGLKYWERSFQVDRLLSSYVWESDRLVVLGGDFNEWFPWTANSLRLERSFRFKSRRVPTFPANWPRFSLDRVFVSGNARILKQNVASAAVLGADAKASDHLALWVDLDFNVSEMQGFHQGTSK